MVCGLVLGGSRAGAVKPCPITHPFGCPASRPRPPSCPNQPLVTLKSLLKLLHNPELTDSERQTLLRLGDALAKHLDHPSVIPVDTFVDAIIQSGDEDCKEDIWSAIHILDRFGDMAEAVRMAIAMNRRWGGDIGGYSGSDIGGASEWRGSPGRLAACC